MTAQEEAAERLRDTLEKLRKIRLRTDMTLRSTPHLRKIFRALDGTDKPVSLRHYQVQMVVHLMTMNRFVVGDDTGLGKTLEAISTLCYLWEKDPNLKVLVLTRKSAVRQWVDEFTKFTEGVTAIPCRGTPQQREAARADFDQCVGPSVLVMGHRGVVVDFKHFQNREFGVLVLDEAVVVKTPASQAHQVIRHIASRSQRVWGMTATLIKNNLVEGYGIFKVVEPNLFKITLPQFIDNYCVTRLIDVGRGRKVKQIVGYKRSDIERFRMMIEPFYLGRPKHEVAKELPPLTIKRVRVGMSPAQHTKYQEAIAGLLEIGTGEEKEVTKLTAVTYCQEIVNHLGLIGCEGDSEKLDELIDLLTEGELAGKKVIVFTRFEKMVTIGLEACEKAGVKCVRITGKENEDERKAAQDTFQDIDSKVQVVWITTAGSDAINLQMAEAIVFYDTPYSAGDYLQILGRMIRIGSIYARVLAIHLVGEKSIDERVMDIMDRKMTLVEAVLGRRIKGDDDEEDEIIDAEDGAIDALFQALRNEAMGILNV